MYDVRIQLFTDEKQKKFEELKGKATYDFAHECVPKFRGYLKEVSTGREMVLCGCCDDGGEYLIGSGRVILVLLPLSTESYPILCQLENYSISSPVLYKREELAVGNWYSLATLKQKAAKISIADIGVYGPDRKVQSDKLEEKCRELVKELPELYHDIFRCLNFTKAYEF